MVLKKVPWKYIYITVICQFEKSFEKECDWINPPWPFSHETFQLQMKIALKVFTSKHSWESTDVWHTRKKRFTNPLSGFFANTRYFPFPLNSETERKYILGVSHRLWVKIQLVRGRERWEAIFQMRGLSILNFYQWFVFLSGNCINFLNLWITIFEKNSILEGITA